MDSTSAKPAAPKAATHLCLPYESGDESARTVLAFVAEGLARRERCVVIASPDEHRALVASLASAGVRAGAAIDRGALALATPAETYYRTGRFEPEDTLSLMEGFVDGALADGFAGVRVTADGSRPIPDDLWAQIVRYEALANERLARRPFTGLCRFCMGDLPPNRLDDVLRTHPHLLARDEVCANPFYERPEIALGADPGARVRWRLHQVRSYNRELKLARAADRRPPRG